MTAPKKPLVRPSQRGATGVSNKDLAHFLMKMADLHSSPVLGNFALAFSLRQLGQRLSRGRADQAGVPSKSAKEKPAKPIFSLSTLRELTEEEIKAFIADPTKTKEQLLDLASARFSMPLSQLRKEKSENIRQAINGALLHESSIGIIGEEATKGGNNRRS